MRVLHVIDTLGRGGAETFLSLLLPRLSTRGIECEILALQPPYTLAADLEKGGVKVHRGGLVSPLDWWGFHRQLARVMAQAPFAAVHAHLFNSVWNAALSRLFRPSLPPLVSTFHSEEFTYYGEFRLRRWLKKWAFGTLLRTVRPHLTAVSQSAARSYQRHCRLASIEVIANGVEPEPTVSRPPGGEFRALFVATLKKVKGHELFLEALRRFKADHPGAFSAFRADLIGEGALRDELRRRIEEYELQQWVQLRGELPNAEVKEQLSRCHLLVLPSLSEGLPMTVLEAMMAGVPVLAAAVGGLPEVILPGLNGLLFRPGRSEELATYLAWCVENPASLAAMGQAGRATAMAGYHIDVSAERWATIYRQLL